MEKIPNDDYETIFYDELTTNWEVSVPLITAESFVESIDATRDYVQNIIKKYNLETLDAYRVVGSIRYTEELGKHYWVRTWKSSTSDD